MAFEITELVITKLDRLRHNKNIFSGSKTRVSSCIDELKKFQKMLKGAEDHETNTHTTEEWQKLIRGIYSLEDIIEPLRRRTTLKSHEIFFEMRLNHKIGKVKSKVRKGLLRISTSPRFARTDSVGAQLPREDVDEDAKNSDERLGGTGDYSEEKSVADVLEGLVNKLAQSVLSSSNEQCFILKADLSCSGKSILLWTVYNAETVKQRFHFRAWINVSQVSEKEKIAKAILEQCDHGNKTDGEALHDFLVWKRFLIVLYGVPEGFLRDSLDSLEAIFPYSLNGSRVILASPHTEDSKSFGEASDERPQQQLVKYSSYLEEDSSTITVKAVIDELAESILSLRRLLFLVSIVGVVGSGKTTLLWAMYNAQDIRSHFQCCAWIQVPEVFNERDLLTDIWEQLTGVKTQTPLPLKSLRQQLRSFLAPKRYLVVLHDVWTAEIWEHIKFSLPNSLNGSRVILVVQEAAVARKTNSWIFGITSGTELLQENASEQRHPKRWERIEDIRDKASAIVGLEDKMQELAELVLNNYKQHFLVSVLGVAGSGKTTFVRSFYSSAACKQHFDCRAWISVLPHLEHRDILLDLYGQLRKTKVNRNLSVEQLRWQLSLFLTWKRYLIVLDDVRTADTWNALNLVLPKSSNGNRVVLTVRKAYIAYHMEPRPVVLSLRRLDEDESWQLFTEKVQTAIKDIPKELKEKILKRCHGMPLTIVVLGGLLSRKNNGENYAEWVRVMEQTGRRSEEKNGMTSPNQQKEAQSTDNATSAEDQSTSSGEFASPDHEISFSKTVVAVTYQNLSNLAKCCLLYLGMFPRLYEIPIRRMLQLWLAEGLVTQKTGETKPLEELAKPCFEELLSTNMIEIAERRLDGSPRTCRVTNTLHDYLLVNAEKAGFFHIHCSSGEPQSAKRGEPQSAKRGESQSAESVETSSAELGEVQSTKSVAQPQPPQCNIRRLADHSDMYINTKPADTSIQRLRSYISFYKKKGDAPTSGVNELLNKIIRGGFGMLVVLDLEGVYKPVLSEMLGKLRQLKYLGLRRTHLDSVPESVGDLPHLQTLDVKRTYIITLPSSIWKAKMLQHLYMSEIYVDVSAQKTSARGTLSNLQTLWGLIIRRKIDKTNWLDNLTGLRKLKLTCLQESMRSAWLSKLSNLQTLKLRSISKSNEPAKLALGEMKTLKRLSRLYLLGEFPKTFKVSELPENLEVLTLSVSRLSDDPMEAIGKMGKLKVLRLYAHSLKRKEMTCHKDGFPKLQVLKLWMLKELQNWTVEENAMPVLKELEIRCCKKLKKVDGLEKLTSLKELTLTNMEQFEADAEEKLAGRVKITKNKWKFPPPWDMEETAEAAQ